MESTTMSGAIGSRPRCATSMPWRVFLSSTALMLEEPTSRPTIVFDPNPNMCPPLLLSGSLGSCLQFFALVFHLARLLFHPLVELRFLEAPPVAQFESRDFLFAYVLIERVRTHSQVLRRLANVHHFSRVGHSSVPLTLPAGFTGFCETKLALNPLAQKPVRVNFGVLSIYQPSKWAARREIPCFIGFFAVSLDGNERTGS